MSDEPPEDRTVIAFRNSAGEPIVVPNEVALAADRAYRCYQMRIEHQSWAQIAETEHYPSAAACKYDVDRYMAEAKALITEESQRELLTLEVMRLDQLGASFWQMANEEHNLGAAKFVLDVIKARVDLTQDKREAQQSAGRHTTVVVPVSAEGYLETLQRVTGMQDAPDLPPPE